MMNGIPRAGYGIAFPRQLMADLTVFQFLRILVGLCFVLANSLSLAASTSGPAASENGLRCHGLQHQGHSYHHPSHHDRTSVPSDDGCLMHCCGLDVLAPAVSLRGSWLWLGLMDTMTDTVGLRPDRLDRPPKVAA
jgi:hypothetical protein